MRNNLRQVELRGRVRVEQMADLLGGIRVRVGPSAQRQMRLVFPDLLAQLPRVRDATRPANRAIAAEDDERGEAVLPRLLGVGEAVLERVLAREERNDPIAGDVGAEVGDEKIGRASCRERVSTDV